MRPVTRLKYYLGYRWAVNPGVARVARAAQQGVEADGRGLGPCVDPEFDTRRGNIAHGPAGEALVRSAVHELGLSARAYHRVLRVARTIADLAGTSTIAPRARR